MSISPQAKSNEVSRPASPATDALEVISLDDEAISPSEDAQRMKSNLGRKTSSWKDFKAKAEMKIKSTFGDSFSKERKAVDGTAVSPTEISPDSVESGSSTPDDERCEKVAELLKNIEDLGAECDREVVIASTSTTAATTPTPTTPKASNNIIEKKDKRVDFVEEPCRKVSFPVVEGAGASRPRDLAFSGDSNAPLAPPRLKKEKRLERLLSVPNIKLNKQDQNRLLNLRKSSNVLEQKSTSPASSSAAKNKGNFMRRFSKYQFHCINQSAIKNTNNKNNNNNNNNNNTTNIEVCVCFSLPNKQCIDVNE